MKPKTQLTKEQKDSAEIEGATKNLLTKMASSNSFPSLTLVDPRPTHFSTPDSKSCRNLTIFGINNGLGQTVLAFKDKKDRAAYIEKSKLVKRIQRRGGRVLEAEFEVKLKQVLKLIPPSYKSPRYKQLVETYTSTRNSWGPQERSLGGLRSLLQKPKRCKDKTRTFACFFHLQELAAIWEMVLHDHMRGGGMHTSALLRLVDDIVCPNQLSEMVIAQVKELIASVIVRMKNLKKEEEEKEDDDTDEGIEEDAIFETEKEEEENLKGCADLSLGGDDGWFQSLTLKSSDDDEEEEDFTVLSSLNPVIINIESDIMPVHVQRRDPANPARRIPSFPQADFGNIINIE